MKKVMRRALGIGTSLGIGAAIGAYAIEHSHREPLHPLIIDGRRPRKSHHKVL